MFNFGDKTQVNLTFKVSDLLKQLKADKQVKIDAKNIAGIKLVNILSPDRTFMEASEQVKEIYIIELTLNSKVVPVLFVNAFNKFIAFQTLFKIVYQNEVKYISSIKQFTDDKIKVLKMFETNWQEKTTQELSITNKIENVFKCIISSITNISFRQDETYQNYISRLDTIKRLKLEIKKTTRTMNAEKQPNIKMRLNDEVKQMKKELQELKK